MGPDKYTIGQYFTDFIYGLEGHGITIISDFDLEMELDKITETGYPVLRELFDTGKLVERTKFESNGA